MKLENLELHKLFKVLRTEATAVESNFKQMKSIHNKINSTKEQGRTQWNSFVVDVAELIRKHDIGFSTHRAHCSTFSDRLQNIKPSTFISIVNMRISQKNNNDLADATLIKIFESDARLEMLKNHHNANRLKRVHIFVR